MERSRLASVYLWAVAVCGLALLVTAVVNARPWAHPDLDVLESTVILLTLTLLSGFSPIETRQGGVLTVTLAPLCGAVALLLPPWAVMIVAALGPIDRRVPGRQIPWDAFAFNRGMWIIACGLPSYLLASLRSSDVAGEGAVLTAA